MSFPRYPRYKDSGVEWLGQVPEHWERRDAEAKALKLPHLKNRKICRVLLPAGAGRIQQTFQPSHHTWWPLAAFDIQAHCGVGTA